MPTGREILYVISVTVTAMIIVLAVKLQLDLGVFLATAVGSLTYVMFSAWDNYVASPKLEFEFDADKPDLNIVQLVAVSSQGTPEFTYRSVRVMIRNNGRRPARGCVGYIQLIYRDKGCTMFSRDPKVLAWVNIPDGNYIPPHGGFAVLGVAFSMDQHIPLPHSRCDKVPGNTRLSTWANTPEVWMLKPNMRLQDAFCVGDFTVKVTVFSESSASVSEMFILKVSDNWQALTMTRTK
jgi:hypothetical protein